MKASFLSVIHGSCYLTVSRDCGGKIFDVYLARTGLGSCSVLKPFFHAVQFTEVLRMLNNVRKSNLTISMMALNGLILFAQIVEKLKNQVVSLKTWEVFAYSTSLIASQNCLCMGFNLPCAKGRSSGVHWRAQKGRLRAMIVPFTLEHGVLMQTMSVIY